MTPIESAPSTRHNVRAIQQRGSTLIITLFMLLLVMLMGLGMVRSSTADERLAGNFRDRDRAESAVQKCLQYVQAGTYTTTGAGTLLTPAGSAHTQNWADDSTYWTDTHSIEVTVDANASSSTGALFRNPRCMVETLGSDSFRVTGRGWGASETTDVILQATYASSGTAPPP
jgi:type IV pilus assembly protein PilX